eukprot:TRINITY_DN7234_c0_g1_i2.p1 TRINITY_DN7234_c0_g1~~TRINITY_DN7234_c0_g1_i2.p1  ORF type:complete len:412 (-),score=68.89 TRINITY_DN7234_c0_g1_i2:55-1290(-)
MVDMVWDFILLQGNIALFKVSLWIMYSLQDKITVAVDFPDVIATLEQNGKLLRDEEGLRNFVANFYINKRVIQIVREKLRVKVKEELGVRGASPPPRRSMPKMRRTASFAKVECNIGWPACTMKLDSFNRKQRRKSFVVMRQSIVTPIIIENHFSGKTKRKPVSNIKRITALDSIKAGAASRRDLPAFKSQAGTHYLRGLVTNNEASKDMLMMFRTGHRCEKLLRGILSQDEEATSSKGEKEKGSGSLNVTPLRIRQSLSGTLHEVEEGQESVRSRANASRFVPSPASLRKVTEKYFEEDMLPGEENKQEDLPQEKLPHVTIIERPSPKRSTLNKLVRDGKKLDALHRRRAFEESPPREHRKSLDRGATTLKDPVDDALASMRSSLVFFSQRSDEKLGFSNSLSFIRSYRF